MEKSKAAAKVIQIRRYQAKSIQLDRASATNLPVLAKRYVIWAVRGQFWPLAQLVSSSKFKLVCQVVNAKKPKKSRVTHLQLKGSYRVLLLTWKNTKYILKTSYLCWIIISYYAKVHCSQKNIMCQLIIKLSAFHCAFWSTPENLLVHCYCSVVVEISLRCRSELTNQKLWNHNHFSQSGALKPWPLWVLPPSPSPNLPSLQIFLSGAL